MYEQIFIIYFWWLNERPPRKMLPEEPAVGGVNQSIYKRLNELWIRRVEKERVVKLRSNKTTPRWKCEK